MAKGVRCWSLGVLLSLVISGCAALAASAPPAEPVPAAMAGASQLIYLDRSLGNEAVVRITTPYVSCSGTLIAEDQVLTAHHCVSRRDQNEQFLSQHVSPAAVRVELGGDYLPWGEIGVRAIVAPPCGHASGAGDIAVLVLDRPLHNVATLSVSLDNAPSNGDEVRPVGFGTCADSGDGIRRKNRPAAAVTQVLSTRFQSYSAICPGDSGGPALSEAGDVIGVISRSAMDGEERTASRTEFTRLDRWQDVFANAKRISEGESPAEQPPVAGCELEASRQKVAE